MLLLMELQEAVESKRNADIQIMVDSYAGKLTGKIRCHLVFATFNSFNR